MPVTWSISDDGRLLSVTGRGVVTETEYLEAHAGFFAVSAGPDPPRCTLADWSGVTHMGFTSDTLWRSTSMTRAEVGPQMAGGRMAMVASSPSVYGMCRQWQAMIQDSGLECAVFQDRAEAVAWLFRP